MKYIYKILLAIAVGLSIPFFASASTLQPNQGGTGTACVPTTGQVLVGTSGGQYACQATSTLNISGSGGGTPGGTTSQIQVNQNGAFAGTTTNPLVVGSIDATSTTATSTFAGTLAVTGTTTLSSYLDQGQLTVPSIASTNSTVGGSMATGTYYYVVTALDQNGNQTTQSAQSAGRSISGSQTAIYVNINSEIGVTSYNVYRTTTSGVYGANSYVGNFAAATGFLLDKLATPTAGSPSLVNNSALNVFTSYPAGTSYIPENLTLGNITAGNATINNLTLTGSFSPASLTTPAQVFDTNAFLWYESASCTQEFGDNSGNNSGTDIQIDSCGSPGIVLNNTGFSVTTNDNTLDDGSGNMEITGKMGIASSTPGFPLTVAGASFLGGNLTATGTIKFTSLASSTNPCLSTSANGTIGLSACAGGGGSGTVTSVAQTVPTGLSIAGSPVTTSGTLALSLTSGYTIPQSANLLSSTTALTGGQLLFSQGANKISSVATSSASCSSGVSCSSFTVVGGVSPSITNSGVTSIVAGSNISISGGTGAVTINATGGAGGGGTWSTTTSSVAGHLINYPNNSTDIPCIGGSATTTCKDWFDPNTSTSYLAGNLGIGTTPSLQGLSLVGQEQLTTGTMYIASSTHLANSYQDGFAASYQHYVFLSGNSQASAGSLASYDVTNPNAPVLLQQIQNSTTVSDAEEIKIVGHYLYLVGFGCGLSIFDISNPANMTLVGELAPNGATFNEPEGLDIVGNYAYVVDFGSSPGSQYGVTVVDISNPTSPTIVGGVTNSSFNLPVYIRARGNILYETNEGTNAVVTMSIASSTNPVVLDTFSPAGSSSGLSTFDFFGKYLYVGGIEDNIVFVVDATNPSSLVSVNNFGISSPTTLKVIDNSLYLTSLGTNSVYQYSLASTTNPVQVASVTDGTNLNSPDDIETGDGHIYVSFHGGGADNGGLAIIVPAVANLPFAQIGSEIADSLEVTHDIVANRAIINTSLQAANIWSQNTIGAPSYYAASSTATSTFADGIRLSGGCFQLPSGACAGSGGGSGTVTSVGLSSPNSTLTIGSTPVTSSGTITGDLNLSNGNVWTAASTTFAKHVVIGTASTSALTATQYFYADGSAMTSGGSFSPTLDYPGLSVPTTFVDHNGTVWLNGGGDLVDSSGSSGSSGSVLIVSTSTGEAKWVATSSLNILGGGSGTVTSVATNNGLTGGTITTSGTIGLNIASLWANALVGWNGSTLVATGSPQLTIGNLQATSSNSSFFTGFLGVGSTSPVTQLGVVGTTTLNGDVSVGLPPQVASTTFSVDYVGHMITGGPAPTVSGGTSSIVAPSNDDAGQIAVAGTALTSVTLTFANKWKNIPSCQESDNVLVVGSDISSISTSTIVFGFGTGGVSTATIWYSCEGVQ